MSYGLSMRVRRLEMPADQGDVLRFLDEATADGRRHGLSENKQALIERDDGRPGIGLIAYDDGAIVGYVGLAPARAAEEWAVEMVLGESITYAGPLVEAAQEAVQAAGGERLRWWAYDPDSQRLPPAYGFEPERDLLRMRRPLPADGLVPLPSGVEIAPFRPGVDDDALLEVNNAAFAHHHDNGAMTRADLSRRMAMEWFEPAGVRMAWEGHRLAGFCWTKVHRSGEGEIYIIGAAPTHQGRGLGKALVHEGMRHLSERGCRQVILYTDGDNERAVALYEHLGFTVDRTHRAFVRDLS